MHALRAPGRRALGLVSLSLLSVLALPLRADGQAGPDGIVILGLEPAPPHPHDPSPVTTWPPDLQNPFHQHQHRTNHDPRRGSIAFGGVSPYIADKVWVGRRSVRMGGDHPVPAPDEFAHGHQGHEPQVPAARYHVHRFPDPTTPAERAWNENAANDIARVLNGSLVADRFDPNFGRVIGGWLLFGNASGEMNWPDTDDDRQPGTGVPWHSSVGWVPVEDPLAEYELFITLGRAEGNLGLTTIPLGHSAPGGGTRRTHTMNFSRRTDWWYGGLGAVPAGRWDFFSTALHEWGHVIGFDHFGTRAANYVMHGERVPSGTHLRVLDPDAVHGVRDLYAICGAAAAPDAPQGEVHAQSDGACCPGCVVTPEPASAVLLATGMIPVVVGVWRRRRRGLDVR